MNVRTVLAAALIFYLLLAPGGAVAGQDPRAAGDEISEEAERLKRLLGSLNLPGAESNQYADGLKRVESAIARGHLFLSLYYLQPVRVSLMTYDYQRSKAEVAKRGVEAFEAEWRDLGQQLAAKEKTAARPFEKTPAAVRALTETSLGQVHPNHQSGRLYGLNTTVNDGLYYMGRAPAFQEFAIFSRQLGFQSTRSSLKLGSMEPELSALEAETLAAYKQAADKDLRPFIGVNVALKVAWDLNRERWYFGALLKYLDASLALKLLDAPAVGADRQAELKRKSAAFAIELSNTTTDHTIGLIYWQMAERALDASSEDLKRASVIIEHVLPRYFKAIRKR
ncbi:MAG TPA: hypothetical protein VKA70_05405 [Blastocatellia bacterium]|nr:hypothetical protein [Blastocatellia bacterium]